MRRSIDGTFWVLILSMLLSTGTLADEGDEPEEKPAAEPAADSDAKAEPKDDAKPADEKPADSADPGVNAPPAEVDAKTVQLWEDYIHYLRIAQVELSTSNGRAFLDLKLSDEAVVRVIDELSNYRDFDKTIVTAQKMENAEISTLARLMDERIKAARLGVARQPRHVRANIELLDDGLRARLNSTERLAKAGEYASPLMLQVLLSDKDVDRTLRPYVIEAMVAIGRPLVAPLCEAMRELPAVPKQQVAEVLSRIGYPLALPFLKAEIIRSETDNDTKQVLQTAFDRIVERSGVPKETDAAGLFLMLGEDYYRKNVSLILEPDQPFNLMWTYVPNIGLTYDQIPTPVFHDVMAMRACKRSLQVNPNLGASASLWLAANFRRENNLGDKQDPSYPPTMQSPHYYATVLGPSHLQPVLFRALTDNDTELARDAIRALRATATTAERLGEGIQPLITALNYPDRRVRYEASFAIGESLPRIEFSGAQRVVPVLSEAVRETAKPVVLVIGPDLEAIKKAVQSLGEEGKYAILFGDNLETAAEQISSAPGVDLIVTSLSAAQSYSVITEARNNFKMMTTPALVLVSADQLATANRLMSAVKQVVVTNAEAEAAQITEALTQALASGQGTAINAEEAQNYAVMGLTMLREIAREAGETFKASDAQPALIGALKDPREPVVAGAALVLSQFKDAAAQRAIANAALDADRSAEMQAKLFKALAESARYHGNLLGDSEIQLTLKFMKQATGPVADAVAEAHGALDLPTSDGVEQIVK